ncbi:MAG: hypothetical protein ACTTJW_02150 [Sphaerochaeta sp.]
MKKALFVLFLLFLTFSLFAATYEITDYSFLIRGKTKDSSISEKVGSTGSTFSTIVDLESFLDEKRQELDNMRLFSHVEYRFVVKERILDFYDVSVTFYIWDASSVFVLPYPKYDSNYGFKLGVKAYNKNLGGTFANLYGYAGISQQNNTFKDGKYNWELSVDSIDLGKADASVSHTGAVDLIDWKNSYLKFSAGVGHIQFMDVEAAFSTYFTFAPDKAEKESKWGFEKWGATANVVFKNDILDNFSISNTTELNVRTFELDTYTRFSYEIGLDLYSYTVLNTKQTNEPEDVNKGLDYVELGTGISRTIPLSDKIGINAMFIFYVQYDYNENLLVPYFDLSFASANSEYDWIGNFRKGVSYDFRLDILSYPINEIERNSFKFWTSISGFAPVNSWFNPSARLSVTMSDRDHYFAFAKDETIADYIRGIRQDNSIVNIDLIPRRKFAVACNMDFMMNFIEIKDFCRSYVIPFVDFLVVGGAGNDTSYKKLTTVGLEGVVILDNHPSYPIRGSLGFNLKDLLRLAKGQIKLSEVEYELFIGMGFFY